MNVKYQELVHIIKGGAICAMLSACGDAGTPNGRINTEVEPVSQEQTISPSLVMYAFADYFPQEMLDLFEESTGVNVDVRAFETLDEMHATLSSEPGSVDVVIVDDATLSELAELGMVEPLDHSKLPMLENIGEDYIGLPFDPINEYSVPYLWGSTLIAYNKEKIPNPDLSWGALWNPAYFGRVMMLSEPEDLFLTALIERGFDRNSRDSKELEQARLRLVEQIENVGVRYGSFLEVSDALADGDVWIAQCYSGDAALVASENEDIDYFIPEEGTALWIDSFAISRDSEKIEMAHEFLNFSMRADVAAACAEFVWYATPNKAAKELLSRELVDDQALFPSGDAMELCRFSDMNVQIDRENLLNSAMAQLLKLVSRGDGSGDGGGEEQISLEDGENR